MASQPPPSYRSSASVSRSKTASTDIRSRADEMLRMSLSGSTPAVSPESVTSDSHRRLRSSTHKPSYTSPALFEKSAEKRTHTSHLSHKSDSNVDRSSSGITAAESKQRLRQLQLVVRQANAQRLPRDTAGMFRKACSTDVLFLVDTTSSMQPYIDAARNQVKSIVRDIKTTFLNETEVRIAVVGYKDHSQGSESIQFLDFVHSSSEVSMFLDGLTASGGADIPEDVLGGIRQAINSSWKLQTRCLIHIADAPAHGTILHDLGKAYDTYHQHGSEPHKLVYTPLLEQLVKLRINYAFLRITTHTDRMLLKFSEIYSMAEAEVKLLAENKYFNESKDLYGAASTNLWSQSSSKNNAQLRFEELPLGTSYTALQHLVVRSVTRSASVAASCLIDKVSRSSSTRSGGRISSRPIKNLTAIREHGDEHVDAEAIPLEKIAPYWKDLGWFADTLTLEGFCPDMGIHSASTLNDMMASDDSIKLGVMQLTVHKRPIPFAAGALRLASYARTAGSTDRFVVKSYKEEDDNIMAQMIEDMRAQALCKAFALEFNSLLKAEYTIDFIVTSSLQDKSKRGSTKNFISLEPFIEGTYVKYNNNASWVKEKDSEDPFNDAAQAFSHFTFERSWGSFLVSDLQGVDHRLTDPAIQTKDPERFKLGPTNLGPEGFKFFFATHECNSVCQKLELRSNKTMFLTDKWEFREHWPTLDNTVCCSNKLCRKMVRLVNAQKSEKFPGCYWCSTCWPQLQSSTIRRHCERPGEDHEFEVSLFFHESQGRLSPRRCADHVERDTTAFNSASASASLWSRMQANSQRTSTPGRAW